MTVAARAELAQLELFHRKAAMCVVIDPRALPVFERLERELERARARFAAAAETDPVARARALLLSQAS